MIKNLLLEQRQAGKEVKYEWDTINFCSKIQIKNVLLFAVKIFK